MRINQLKLSYGGPKSLYGKRIRWNSQNHFVIDENGVIDEAQSKTTNQILKRFRSNILLIKSQK
jgi:peroxiredoxin